MIHEGKIGLSIIVKEVKINLILPFRKYGCRGKRIEKREETWKKWQGTKRKRLREDRNTKRKRRGRLVREANTEPNDKTDEKQTVIPQSLTL